ncbi:MAG: dephospho-CoA kinase [candidate division WOR-3 bacterium]
MVIGIGGNLGSGKTTLTKFLQNYGAKVIPADKIGWSLLRKSTPQYRKIVQSFGKDIQNSNGTISRKKLAKVVFASRKKLALLNRIVHPALIDRINKTIGRFSEKKNIIILDAALLFNWDKKIPVDVKILVSAKKRLKIARLKELGISRKEAERRLSCQLTEKTMAKKADIIVKNNGTKKELARQAKKLFAEFRKMIDNSVSNRSNWCRVI